MLGDITMYVRGPTGMHERQGIAPQDLQTPDHPAEPFEISMFSLLAV